MTRAAITTPQPGSASSCGAVLRDSTDLSDELAPALSGRVRRSSGDRRLGATELVVLLHVPALIGLGRGVDVAPLQHFVDDLRLGLGAGLDRLGLGGEEVLVVLVERRSAGGLELEPDRARAQDAVDFDLDLSP